MWPQAVLFDFDGTLADSYEAIAASINYVRSQTGLESLSTPDVCRHVGRGLIYLLECTVPNLDASVGADLYRQHHPTAMREGTRLLPGAMQTLMQLKQTGRSVAICSNKPRMYTDGLVDYLQLRPLVDTVLGPEDVSSAKPAPDMVLEGLRRLSVAPPDALYVGDMVIDIQTARAANVTVWVVPTGSEDRERLEQANADCFLESLTDFMDHVTDKTGR